jgi:pyruvate formate lyase activating enzyme
MPSGYHLSVEEVFERIVKDKPYYEPDGGVTISGGEPMQQFSFTYALAKQCNENGISVCLDTTGYAPEEDYLSIRPYIDRFLYDLKQMDSHQSEKLTGVPNEQILSNAESIAAHGGNFQIRVPIIPKLNDTEENLRRTAQFCVSTRRSGHRHPIASVSQYGNRKIRTNRTNLPSEKYQPTDG